MPKLQTQSGKLTPYAFACGYVETLGSFRIWYETPVYHVNGFDANGVRRWESTRTLTEARKILRRLGREKDGRKAED